MKSLGKNIVYLAWIQAIIATLGSLYFSEIRHFTPCVLCWYQRILMYPQTILITVGILRKDTRLYQYILPMSILGFFIASYHVMLEKGVLSEAVAPCRAGVSCTAKYVGYLGFITIPVMSLTAFTIICICMFLYWRLNRK